ncbi:MAG: MFS transporter [Alphaproteobacteria bacterium]|nr:MFS transporter [Alphaproteobacteria bacterium]
MAAPPLYDLSGIARVFSNRNYAIYSAGAWVSLVGLWVQRLGVGWLAWELTHSGFWLGAVAFADLFPVLVVGLFGGVLADRFDRRRILLVSQYLQLGQATALWLMFATGVITIEWLFALTLFTGVVVALGQPARLSLVPQLVRSGDVGGAVAIHAVNFNLARFVGPAVAGYLISVYDVGLAFLFNAVTYVAFIAALLALRLPAQRAAAGNGEGVLRQVGQGIAYAVGHPGVAAVLLLMAATSFLVRPVFELLPGFADHVFASDAAGLATLTSAVGLGALSGGLWLAQRATALGSAAISVANSVLLAVAGLVFIATDILWVGAGALAFAGFAAVAISVSTQTLVQTGVPSHVRGRVLSIWGMLLRGVPAAGALAMGSASDFVGLKAPLLLGALACLAGALALARWARTEMRALETLEESAAAPPPPAEAAATTG